MSNINHQKYTNLSLFFAVTVRIVTALYWIVRYGQHWLEDDTARITAGILAVFQSGQLAPESGRIYANGFLYPVYGTFLAHLADITIIDLQIWGFIPLTVALTVVIFVFYKRILNNPVAAAAATVMINLQADFIFTSSRGTHEKIVYMLVCVSLIAITFSTMKARAVSQRIAFATVYYLSAFALSTTNVFFASTFTVMMIAVFLTWYVLATYTNKNKRLAIQLAYIASVSFIFVYLITFIIYPPAINVALVGVDLVGRVGKFLLSYQPQETVYQAADQAWIFPRAWLFLRLFDLSLMALAAFGWLDLARKVIKQRDGKGDLPTKYFWLLSLFPAFAIQNFLALLSDLTGSASDISNLQIRLAPLTAFVAAPLAIHTLQQLWARRPRQQNQRRLATSSMALVMVVFLSMVLIKSTSEPMLSNTWLFYTPAEATGVSWLDEHIVLPFSEEVGSTSHVWAGSNFRVGRLWLNNYWNKTKGQIPVTSSSTEPYQFIFLSSTIRQLAARQHKPLPNILPALRVYDNGDTRIYLEP